MARYRRRIYLAEGKLGSSMKFSYPNMHMQNTRRALVVVTLVCYLISISCCNLGATVVRRKIRNHRCIMRQDYADYWISEEAGAFARPRGSRSIAYLSFSRVGREPSTTMHDRAITFHANFAQNQTDLEFF